MEHGPWISKKGGFFSLEPPWIFEKGIFFTKCVMQRLLHSPSMDFQWECFSENTGTALVVVTLKSFFLLLNQLNFNQHFLYVFFTKWGIVSDPKYPRFHGKRGVKMSKISMERGVL